MSLPPLLKHVYNHGTEEVIRRGKRIFHTAGVQLLETDHLLEQVRFRVRNDLYQNYYTVTVNKYLNPKDLAVRCQCPYNLGDICRHEVAALFQLNDIIQSGFFEHTDITYDQRHTVVRMRQVSMQMLRVFTSPDVIERAEMLAIQNKAIILADKTDKIEAEVPDGDATYKVAIKQNEERYFDTSCSCDATTHPLCLHKATLFIQLLRNFGPQYFQTMRDWDEQKNKLLKQYGYSLKDDLTDKFTFTYEGGKPFLRVLDASIKKVAPAENYKLMPSLPNKAAAAATAVADTDTARKVEESKRLGIVLDPTVSWYPFVDIALVAGNEDDEGKSFVGPIEKLELQQYINALRYKESDRELLPTLRKFTPEEVLKYLKKNLPFGDFLDDYVQVLKEQPADEIKDQVWEYLLPKYQKLLERNSNHQLSFIKQKGKKFTSASLEPVGLSPKAVHPQLGITKEANHYGIALAWRIEDNYVDHDDVTMLNAGLLMYDYIVYALANTQEVHLVEQLMPDGKLEIKSADWPLFLQGKLMEWSKIVHVNFAEEIVERIDKAKPDYKLFLQEREQMLVLQPAFSYDGVEIKWGFFGDVIQPHNGVVKVIQRNEVAEQEFLQMLNGLHSDMQQNKKGHFYYLPATSVLANNWFFRFTDIMREWQVDLQGFEGLKQLRINTHKPETRVHVSSGIDWFDASVELTFGEQTVSIIDVKKALAQKQNFVKLGDGSFGLLPEEWLKKYALLIKIGETKGNKIRLKKFHFSVLDELLAEVDEEALQQELEEKKERLDSILSNDYSNITPPAELKAELRPYQLAGFQWLVFLNEAGWGGILADDMGLGKTVQTLTFFQHYKNKHPEAKFLVVCPTTLMYNWENEIRKFTPDLTHFIHHGPKRTANINILQNYDIIITTYGTMRSDIKIFKEIDFDYSVLDESQSIKNPQSQVAKASLLLNSKNRLALSGTPIQNNTFDLYSQMNFLNPGMLGSREFFMNEFATPIDKFMEDEVKQQLRKLTYPFMLRRTKEQVAKDLPAKTETVLYCEMGTEQRKIYEAYRNTYQEQIMGLINERGIERSQMHILQGLTKLRQICDSPAILNEEERFHNYSIKLDELTREITENVGNHKALIFSQFLGMLGLIRKELEAKGIPYAYFDGSSTSTQREQAIQQFQNNEECRVFLISLKAGGIGLNLTAADYVYIVDPWWNPAVEQQAIDRTHRIGQTKNIFAYRLICKDTIEEKMLILQERKRILANELVSDDSAFLKRLTKEDIAYLLS
ncbi:MAG: helicase SNF2 [Sphingobacteriales bacterium]|nr:MAG: helicase SNF2 [Sphingobacteriales bacterium]